MAAAPPAPPSPSVTFLLADQEGVEDIKKMMAAGTLVETSLKIKIPRLERLDAAPGICKALSKALGKWKRRVAPDLTCHVLRYVKVKTAATISKELGSVSKIFRDVSANPGNLVLYSRLTNLANKMLKSVRPLPDPARRRVRRFANRVIRLANRGEKYGDKRPQRIRDRVAVLAGKVSSFQAMDVLIG